MRNELKNISENIDQTSRLGYLFGKRKVVNMLTEQLTKVEENITALEAEKAKIEADLAKHEEDLVLTQQELSDSLTHFNHLSVQYTEIQATLKQAEENIATLKTQKANVENDLVQKQADYDQLQTEYTQLSSEKSNLDRQLAETQEKLKQEHSNITQLQSEKSALETELVQHKNELVKLNDELTVQEKRYTLLTEEFAQLQTEKEKVEAEKSAFESQFAQQSETLESIKRNLKRKETEIDDLNDEIDDLSNDLSKMKKALLEAEDNYANLLNDNQILQQEHQKLQAAHEHLGKTFDEEQATTKLRETLVGKLLSAKNDNVHLNSFRQILHNEFLPFAAEESSLQNEAGALLKLQEIEKELSMISGLPAFHSARTIAVGGGFSAGKSEFISSFFKNKALKLPSSIEPTTAIPTYVVNQANKDKNRKQTKTNLIGINTSGATVDLLKIDPNLTQKLSHQFMRSFNFPLKIIMPYMFLTTELTYEHICFVDTPEYNPTGSHTAEDMNIAKEFVSNSEALIWLVGADANGTIPRTDIKFLKEILEKSKKPVYFVLSKADLKHKSDVVKILNEFNRVLERERINFAGISAYNSMDGKEVQYWHSKKNLNDFLTSMNKSSNKQSEILQKLYEVEYAYQFAIKKDIKQRKTIAKVLDNISFNLNMENFKRGNHMIYDQLDTVASYFNTSAEEEHLKTLEKLMTNFTHVINQMFGKVSQIKRPNVNIDHIEIEEFQFEESLDDIKELEVIRSEIRKVSDEFAGVISSIQSLF